MPPFTPSLALVALFFAASSVFTSATSSNPILISLQPCTYHNVSQEYAQMDGPLNPVNGLPINAAYVSLSVSGQCVIPVVHDHVSSAQVGLGDCTLEYAVWNISFDRSSNGMQLTPSGPFATFAGYCLSAPLIVGGGLFLSPCDAPGTTTTINTTQLWAFNGNPAYQGLFPFSNTQACATVSST